MNMCARTGVRVWIGQRYPDEIAIRVVNIRRVSPVQWDLRESGTPLVQPQHEPVLRFFKHIG